MLTQLENAKKVIGIKQSTRAIEKGEAKIAFIARDVDQSMMIDFKRLCDEHGIEVVFVDSMKQLGKICSIEVGAATAVILK